MSAARRRLELTKRTFLSSADGGLIAAAAGKPDPAPAATRCPGFLRACLIPHGDFRGRARKVAGWRD
jgi:hypothetical protein